MSILSKERANLKNTHIVMMKGESGPITEWASMTTDAQWPARPERAQWVCSVQWKEKPMSLPGWLSAEPVPEQRMGIPMEGTWGRDFIRRNSTKGTLQGFPIWGTFQSILISPISQHSSGSCVLFFLYRGLRIWDKLETGSITVPKMY